MSVVPATVRCWLDARGIWRSGVWARLAAEAELEAATADLSATDWYTARELYAIACDISSFAELLERRADLAIRDAE